MGTTGSLGSVPTPSITTMETTTPYTNLSAEVQNALSELNADNTKYQPQNAAELIRLEESVQIFFVTSDGRVSTFSAPETLRIFQFAQDQAETSSTFLQVGGWTHPLIPGASPCLQAENGTMAYLIDAARGGLIAYGTVYTGLESSAKVLGKN